MIEWEHSLLDAPFFGRSGPLSGADFAATSQRLSERYLRYVRPELQDGVRMLCCMGQWTDELYDQLSRRLPQLPREGESGYNDLIHLTYIQRGKDRWAVTRAVAEVLRQELSGTLFHRLAGELADIAVEEAHRLCRFEDAKSEDVTALGILLEMTADEPDARAAAAMNSMANAHVKLCELDKARLWQERALEQWRRLDNKPMCLLAWDRLAGILDDMALHKERDEALRDGLTLAEELGESTPPDVTVRLCERKARFSATWEEDAHARKKVLELYQMREYGGRTLWMAQCRFGRSLGECDEPEREGLARDAAVGRAQAQGLLEEAFQALQDLDKSEGRAFSPCTLLAAEALCQLLDNIGQTHQLEQIQSRTREWLPCAVARTEPLEELLVWQEWLDMFQGQADQLHCGLDPAGVFELQRQVMWGLCRQLGQRHPEALRTRRRTVEAYLNSNQNVVSGMDELGAELAADLGSNTTPIGSVKKARLTFFDDPEDMTGCCRELVELYTLYLGREHPATFEALSAQEAEALLRAILEQCGRLGKSDARSYLSSARQWYLAHENQAETETQEAVEAAWRKNGGCDDEY